MKHFKLIADGFDLEPLRQQIEARPDLWNVNKDRLGGGTFAGTSDQWLRYRERSELTSPEKFLEPHFAVNYPSWYALPAAQDICFELMRRVRGVYLGGVLISRIPAGGEVKPHNDKGSWHSEFMNCKIYVPVMTNERCVNYCGDESVVMRVGQAVSFDNLVTHSVVNRGDTDRMTLIVCIRVEE